MSEPFVFDSRCEQCKSPFGAVPCGQKVTLHCRPLLKEDFDHCALVVQSDFTRESKEYALTRTGTDGERARFSITFSVPEQPDLLWYYFRLWRDDKTGCDLDRTGYRSDGQQLAWQLTVYEESNTPQWFSSGPVYQIFPDRFCRLSIPDPTGMIGNRQVHTNWNDSPEWKPDENGIVQNRDFFGGSLAGIESKLNDLVQLGISTIYLCPIFTSASNHRYNTADYETIDPMLGTETDFRQLCDHAKKLGIHILLDGVFNHTGSQSRYFNEDGYYPQPGAIQGTSSPYYSWYSFHPWPDDYDAWWGIRTLPAVREDAPGYADYIIDQEDSIVRHWLRCGASGWRLDVADELPDWFIEKIRTAMEETKDDSLLIGEVWEDASNKIAYSQRRRYLLGRELHSVMNYPFRTALLNFLRGGDAYGFQEAMETLRENYPPAAFYSAMNFLGTHDTARILTVLGADGAPLEKEQRAAFHLSPQQRIKGLELLRLASLVLFTFPGVPTIYYGDEVGMEGWEDPFNRNTYPWGKENQTLKAWFQKLGQLRRHLPCLQSGTLVWQYASGALLAYSREKGTQKCLTILNRSNLPRELTIPWSGCYLEDLLSNKRLLIENGNLSVVIPPRSGFLFQ